MAAPPLTPEEYAALPHDDRGPTIVAVHWSMTSLATIFLGLRLYCKRLTKRSLWWDDWILIFAWFTIIATDVITQILVNEFKLGRHSWDLEINDLARFIILLSSRATATLTALSWTKTAFAVTLLRLTADGTRTLVWFIIVSLQITMGFSAAVPWIQCNPIAKTWDPMLPGTCWANKVGTKIWIGTGAYSALLDFTLAALPWTFILGLLLRKGEKAGILVAMSMGVVAGIVGIVKCVKLPNLGSGDSYNETDLYIWDITESTVTLMAACIPTLRVLLQKASPSGSRPTGFSNSFRPTVPKSSVGYHEMARPEGTHDKSGTKKYMYSSPDEEGA
ncbi:hypothetical protein B0T14DRAFT_602995 [Immersiella caudata]|uniref:Rhodopsin domain-containing protein n=1 Tax=Immersiella caudata TaxID=314043 RepID=A0AA39WPB3_9PEZI|nr:hypothetical protein B0T14DRAFT_602995 [Immersiella caudata]